MGEMGSETCQKIPTEGQTCDLKTGFLDCDIGLYCDADSLKCMRRIPAGGACENFNCASNTFCDSTGMCRGKPGLGEECGSEDWCMGDLRCTSGYCRFPPASPVCE
jgi:hypothetical protein